MPVEYAGYRCVAVSDARRNSALSFYSQNCITLRSPIKLPVYAINFIFSMFLLKFFFFIFFQIKTATVELEPADQQQLSLLTIRNVNRETIGRFVCMAKNDKGEAQSNPVILDVQCKSINGSLLGPKLAIPQLGILTECLEYWKPFLENWFGWAVLGVHRRLWRLFLV